MSMWDETPGRPPEIEPWDALQVIGVLAIIAALLWTISRVS